MVWLAGTTRKRTLSDTFFPLMISAPTRRSSIRPLLQEPRNASLISMPHASSAGTTLSTKSGLATTGRTLLRSNVYSLTYFASGSLWKTAFGSRPCSFRYSMAFSSASKIPVFAPASTAMLQSVIRSLILNVFAPSPVNSIT